MLHEPLDSIGQVHPKHTYCSHLIRRMWSKADVQSLPISQGSFAHPFASLGY